MSVCVYLSYQKSRRCRTPPEPRVQSLEFSKAAKRYGVSAPLESEFVLGEEAFHFQYEVRLTQGLSCGGAYVKLVAAGNEGSFAAEDLTPTTPYSIMFGPDVCGATNKVHLILQVRNPISGDLAEHHLVDAPLAKASDKLSHLYGLTLRPDGSFSIAIDGKAVKSGSVQDSDAFKPPLQCPQEVPDPSDKKPADWVEQAKIPDASAVKPDDWDEEQPRTVPDESATKPDGWLDDAPSTIPDPDAEKPEDWDDEEDGEWEAPTIDNPACEDAPGCGEWVRPHKPNPAYRGKWSPPLVDNPAYKGEWSPRLVPNPAFFESQGVKDLAPITAVAVEVWTMSAGIMFDNFLITSDEEAAHQWTTGTFMVKSAAQQAQVEAHKSQAAAAARAAAWEEGGVLPWLQLVLVEAAQWGMQNPALLTITALALVGGGVFMCFTGSSVSDDADIDKAFTKMDADVADSEDEGEDLPGAQGEAGEEAAPAESPLGAQESD